jgi:hypothetical protein
MTAPYAWRPPKDVKVAERRASRDHDNAEPQFPLASGLPVTSLLAGPLDGCKRCARSVCRCDLTRREAASLCGKRPLTCGFFGRADRI